MSFVALRSGGSGPQGGETAAGAIAADGLEPLSIQLTDAANAIPPVLLSADGQPMTDPAAVAPKTMATNAAPTTMAMPKNHDKDQVHNYLEHVDAGLGSQMLAPDQAPYGGYEYVGPKAIRAVAPITGLRPVAEQAIADVKERDKNLKGQELEHQIAKRLTDLNDWEDLKPQTQAKMMLLAGIDISSMSKQQREEKVNHLLHSPLPFGDIPDVLSPDVTIDIGYTHTLDKDWTKVASLGNGLFQIWMVSNNNNGSHTDHSLGSFKVQLAPGTTNDQARKVGNDMVVNKNDNDRLALDVAVEHILYGQTPPLDYSKPQPTTTMAPATTATTAGDATTTGPTTTMHDHGSTTATAADSTSTTKAGTGSTTTSMQ